MLTLESAQELSAPAPLRRQFQTQRVFIFLGEIKEFGPEVADIRGLIARPYTFPHLFCNIRLVDLTDF